MHVGELFEGFGLARKLLVKGLAAHPIFQLAIVLGHMHAPVIGVGIFVQVRAEHRLRLVPFGDAHSLETGVETNPCIHPDEVDVIGAQQQQLRHDRIIVLSFGQMTVRALLCLRHPNRMREMRREGLTTEPD